MGLLEKIFVVINLVLAVGICVALGSTVGTVTDEKEQHEKQAVSLRKNLAACVKENGELKADLKDETKRADNAERDAREKAATIKRDTAELTTLKTQKTKLEDDLAAAREEYGTLDRELKKKELELSNIHTTIVADLKTQLATKIRELAKVRTDRDAALTAAAKKLADNIAAAKVEKERLEKRIRILIVQSGGRGDSGKTAKITGTITTDPVPGRTERSLFITVTTAKGSKAARIGDTFYIYRLAAKKPLYLGEGRVVTIDKILDEQRETLTIQINDPVKVAAKDRIRKGDTASTFLNK